MIPQGQKGQKERGGALVPRCALAAHTPEPTTGPRAARSNPCSIPVLERVQLRPAATARGQQQCHDFSSAERRASLQMRFGWGTLRPARSTRLSGFPCWGTTAGVVLAELRTAKVAAVDREQCPLWHPAAHCDAMDFRSRGASRLASHAQYSRNTAETSTNQRCS